MSDQSPSGFSVEASPVNGLKLDALLWSCGGIILLIILEYIKTGLLLELSVLAIYGTIATLSIVFRARRLIAAAARQQQTEETATGTEAETGSITEQSGNSGSG